MAGIKSHRSPFPTKPKQASGLFKQRGNVAKGEPGTNEYAMKATPGKVSGRRQNNTKNNKTSQRSNPTLNRGTSNR